MVPNITNTSHTLITPSFFTHLITTMNNLDKLKLASSSFTDRLLTGGAQVSRLVGTKMKEILQSPSPESKLVDDATLETLTEPNWSLNLRICGMVNNEHVNGTEIVKAIKRIISLNKNDVCVRLSIDLLEILTANCDKVFSEVASEKVLEELVVLVKDGRTTERNRDKAVRLIRVWGESEELMYLPVFRQTYLSLKNNGITGVKSHGGNSRPMNQTTESMDYQQPMPSADNYPLPDIDLMGIEDDTSPYTYVVQSVEQKKELLLVGRNSLELLSSILDSGMEPIPINDELPVSMLEKCEESLPIVQRIAETTTDDDILLFEALNLHDELEEIISRCAEIKGIVGADPLKEDTTKATVIIPISSSEHAEETALANEVKVKDGSQTELLLKDESVEHEHKQTV